MWRQRKRLEDDIALTILSLVIDKDQFKAEGLDYLYKNQEKINVHAVNFTDNVKLRIGNLER